MDGVGWPTLKLIGRWMGVCFQTGLSIILVGIAKGWTMSSDTLKQDLRFKGLGLGLFMGYGAGNGRFFYFCIFASLDVPLATRI